MEKLEEFVGECTVTCSFRSIEDNFIWAFADVYGPHLDSDRSLLLDELAGLHSLWDVSWYIGGDFNMT